LPANTTISQPILQNLVATGASTFPAGSAGAPSITTSGDTNTGIFVPAADTIAFTEGGVESARFDSNGRFGIGTTSPTRKLHLSASGANCAIRIDNTASGRPVIIAYDDSQNLTITNSSDTGNVSILNGTGAGTERVRITSAGVVDLLSGQLKFPASQNASSDANTLDDYEEGTWTPTLIGTGGNPTSTVVSVSGAYTKIGSLVTLRCSALWTWSGGSGSIRVGGIPFTTAGVLSIGTLETGGTTFGGSFTWGGTLLGTGDTQVQLRKYSNAGTGETDVALSNVASGTWIRFTITYQAA
jgi:hypothetical protein